MEKFFVSEEKKFFRIGYRAKFKICFSFVSFTFYDGEAPLTPIDVRGHSNNT